MTTALAGGRYELGEVVGTGGMARVRRATDTVLGRLVAVKVFREDLDADSAARARTEMQTLASLTHPNLVAVHDAGTSESGQPYLVMELVEGPTLAACCLDGSLEPERLRSIGADLAEALAYVHGRGVVHRDVKPANILLSSSGAKLADFGVARIVDGVRHTGTGLTVGTAPYLAPEQVTGDPVTPAADVYALGLVLLEVLTGRREFDGGPVETAMARLHRQPVVPADLPVPWPALLTAMTARQPADRPTAAQVAATLRDGTTVGGPERTTVLPTATETLVVPSPTAALPRRTGAPSPTAALPRRTGAPTRVARVLAPAAPRRRSTPRTAVALLVALAAVLLVAAAFAAVGSGGSSTPPSAPHRSPLETHLSELQKAVSR